MEFRTVMLVGYLCAHETTPLTLLQRDKRSPAAGCEDGLCLCWFRCWLSGTPLMRGTLNRGAKYIRISVVSSADFRSSFLFCSSPVLTYFVSAFLFSRFRARPFDRYSLCTCICIPYVITSCV